VSSGRREAWRRLSRDLDFFAGGGAGCRSLCGIRPVAGRADVSSMKCLECGGRLEGPMTFCPFCGVRQDIDLRQIHFRDLGVEQALSCPQCETGLQVMELDLQPPLRIERCGACAGLFFNPGELEVVLDGQTHAVAWFDLLQLKQITEDFERPRGAVYRKCPICDQRMNHLNFGGRSGVVVDHCAAHGLWLEAGHLRRLAEW